MNDKISISLDKRLVDDIKSFCKLNDKKYLDYITEILESRLALDMYGDLNEKIKPKKTILSNKVEDVVEKKVEPESTLVEEKPVVVETPKTEKKIEEVKPKTKKRVLNSK